MTAGVLIWVCVTWGLHSLRADRALKTGKSVKKPDDTCLLCRQARSLTLSRHLQGQFRKDAHLFTVSHLEWHISAPLSFIVQCKFKKKTKLYGVKRVACFCSACCTDALPLHVGLDVSQVSDHSDLLCVFAVAAVTCHCRISQCVVNLRAEDFPLCFRHTATLCVVHSDDFIHLVLFKMSNWHYGKNRDTNLKSVKGTNPLNHWTDTETGCKFLHQNVQTLI